MARELGFVRVTCYKAHQAGIFTGRDVSDQRSEFYGCAVKGEQAAQLPCLDRDAA
ncbi:hypothetical protein [Mycobacterium sp. 1274756.6]|uniref:hypothetical protein n=1 Tax=Mycobacterium sp. 1274756.6 TaxID=1834076 RepID=UPI000A6EF985|nr:hypothetical protein [Mycobacterium sp. 1274756.6]